MIWPSKVGMVGLSIKKNRKSISSQKNSKKGFTLVELIVVLVILAIMAAAVIPALLGYTDHAKDKKYIETAKECLKASQTVLSDTFNNSSNTISMEKRYSAADMANVYIKNYNDDPSDPKKVGTRFYVWTAKRLEATGYKSTKPDGTQSVSSGTKATTDNMGAYTIVYAAFDTGNDKYVVYDGKDWTVKEKEDIDSFNLESSANVPEKYSKNIIHMWDYVDTDACDPKGYDVAGEDWTGKEGVSLSRKVILHFVNNKEDHGVVLASSEGGETISRDYSTFTLELNFTKEDSVIKCNECINLRDGSEISVGGSKEYLKVEEDFSDLRWSTDPSTVGDRQWTEDLDDLLSQIEFPQDEESEEMEPMDIYAWTTKDIEKRNVNFVVTSSGNLKPAGSTQTIEFRCYANKYDKARNDGGYSLIRDEHGATDGPVSDPTGQNGYEFAGWAHNVSDDYERDADDKLVAYSDVETIWKAVFNTPEGQTPTFTAIGELNKTIIFKTDLHSGFGGLTQKELTVPIYKNDLTGEENDPESIYNAAELKLDYGYRLKNWVEEISETEFGFEFEPIKNYVIAGSEDSYTFKIVTEQIRGAKIIGGVYTESGNVPYSIRSLSNESVATVTRFVRDSFGDGVTALGGEKGIFGDITTESSEDGRLLGNLSASGDYISSTISAGNHIAVYGVNGGSISKAAVLWDGDDSTYQAPIFAYSKVVDGNTEIHWFSFEDNPEVFGSLSHTFDGFTNSRFAGSGIDDWNMKKCNSTSYMFSGCSSLFSADIDFTKWGRTTLEDLTTCELMFNSCMNLGFTYMDFSGLDMPKLTTIYNWLAGCDSMKTVTLNGVKTPLLTNVSGLLVADGVDSPVEYFNAVEWEAPKVGTETDYRNNKLVKVFMHNAAIKQVDFTGADLSGLKTMAYMFNITTNLTHVHFESANLQSVTNASYLFVPVNQADDTYNQLQYVSFKDADLSSLKDMSFMFFHCKDATTINISTKNILKPEKCQKTFDQCRSVTEIQGLEDLDTSRVTDMSNMFYYCESMDNVTLDTLKFDRATNCTKMFKGAEFKKVDLSNCSIPATNVYGMFKYCVIDTLDLSNCDMSTAVISVINNTKVSNESVFFGSSINNLIMTNWKINCGNAQEMFQNLTTSSDLIFDKNYQDFSNATSISKMFKNVSANSIVFSNYELADNISAESMFEGTHVKSFDISNNDMSGVTTTKNMFKYFESKNGDNYIGTLSFENIQFSSLSGSAEGMFYGTKINGLNLNNCNMSRTNTTKEFFREAIINDLKISGWDISGSTNANSMFNSFKTKESIVFTNPSGTTDLSSLKDIKNMFANTEAKEVILERCDLSGVTLLSDGNNGNNGFIKTCKAPTIKIEYCDISGVQGENFGKALMNNTSIKHFSFKGTNVSSCTSLNSFCENCSNLEDADFSEMIITNNKKLCNMFKYCRKLKSVKLTVYSAGKTELMDASNNFLDCTSLDNVEFGTDDKDAVSVNFSCISTVKYMFDNCTSFDSLALQTTFSKVDISTQYNGLFNNSQNTEGNNSLYTSGKCHADFKSGTPVSVTSKDGKTLQIGGGNSAMQRRLKIID